MSLPIPMLRCAHTHVGHLFGVWPTLRTFISAIKTPDTAHVLHRLWFYPDNWTCKMECTDIEQSSNTVMQPVQTITEFKSFSEPAMVNVMFLSVTNVDWNCVHSSWSLWKQLDTAGGWWCYSVGCEGSIQNKTTKLTNVHNRFFTLW